MAQATFAITQAAGSFSGSEGARLTVNVFDSGLPGGTGDKIRLRGSSGKCDFGTFTATRTVDNGNISVHQAS
jgi:hypothetical protein